MGNQNPLDTLILLSVFPTEIWLVVLNHVDSFTDYLHICDSSTYLTTTLRSLRTTVLFRNAIEIFSKWGAYKSQRLSTKDVLSLRLVSYSWKNRVDKTLCHFDLPYVLGLSPEFRGPFAFSKYRKPITGNPFLSRRIDLSVSSLGIFMPVYCSELQEMLRSFGHHIWYCSVSAYIKNTEEQINFFHRLPKILELMPNLRRLHYSGSLCDSEQLLPKDNFATLKHLEVLHIRSMPVSLLERLAKSSPQITTVSHNSYVTPGHLQMCLKEMPKLNKLSFGLDEVDNFKRFSDSVVTCHLTKLQINLMNLKVSWNAVFLALESDFGKTLQYLRINLPDTTILTEGCSLNLPNLKTLSLFMRYPTNLDFLLGMNTNLEKLGISCSTWKCSQQTSKEHLLKVFECGEKLHTSNIWERFVKLKLLTFLKRPHYVCTRGSWKQQKTFISNDWVFKIEQEMFYI